MSDILDSELNSKYLWSSSVIEINDKLYYGNHIENEEIEKSALFNKKNSYHE